MAYIGNQPSSAAYLTDQFSGNGSTVAFTMSVAPATTASILVSITGILQDPTTYSVAGTTITFSAAPPSGTGNISVRYLGIPASGVATTAYRTLTEFTATAGQTSFSVPSYTVGFINVYRNGVRLGTADFTASNGTTVVLGSAATVGDLVVTESFYVSSVLNAIPAIPGSVGTSNIATNAVTSTHIASVAGSVITGSQSIPKSTLPTGSVLQVVSSASIGTTGAETTSTSWVDTGLTLSITPTSASNKIVVVSLGGLSYRGGSYPFGKIQIYSSLGAATHNIATYHLGENDTVTNHYVAAPSSSWEQSLTGWTSGAITYKVQIASGNGVYWQYGGYGKASLYAMEIAG